jgi:hypothetical protein
MSISKASPVVFNGRLRRSERKIVSGELLIAHNRAKFTTSLAANNLEYTEVCCHPISGSLEIEITGSRNNSGAVTFQQCGQARFDSESRSRTLPIGILTHNPNSLEFFPLPSRLPDWAIFLL